MRPLPADGKIVVRRGGLRAEALLQLPAPPTRSSAEGPAALWLTVGLLAADGLALQLRLKRNERVRRQGVRRGLGVGGGPACLACCRPASSCWAMANSESA
jgi:hypothetical protein